MVGKTFKVIFSKKAKSRRQMIMDFEMRRVSVAHAKKIDRAILKSARKLEKFPESYPPLPDTDTMEPRIRYVKAFSYKVIFTVFKAVKEVVVLTIRNDAEDTNDVLKDVKP